jgi:hypothetical protein
MLAHTAPEGAVSTLYHAQLSVIVWTSNFTLKGETKKVSQNTCVGLPCPLPSQLLSCSVIFPVHYTVSSLELFLKSIFFSWEEGQVKRSSIIFLWPRIAGSRRARWTKVGHPPASGQLHRKDCGIRNLKAYYQAFFWVLIDLIVELLGLIIKSFDNQTESWNPVSNDLINLTLSFDNQW